MLELVIYGIGFFLITLCIQAFLHKVRKNENKGSSGIWTGMITIIAICITGIMMKKVALLSAVIGFVVADEFGKKMGWHD